MKTTTYIILMALAMIVTASASYTVPLAITGASNGQNGDTTDPNVKCFKAQYKGKTDRLEFKLRVKDGYLKREPILIVCSKDDLVCLSTLGKEKVKDGYVTYVFIMSSDKIQWSQVNVYIKDKKYILRLETIKLNTKKKSAEQGASSDR